MADKGTSFFSSALNKLQSSAAYNALDSAFSKTGREAAGLIFRDSASRKQILSAALKQAGSSALIGAGAGAFYGAMDKDTSVLGGATKGALLGAGVGLVQGGTRSFSSIQKQFL